MDHTSSSSRPVSIAAAFRRSSESFILNNERHHHQKEEKEENDKTEALSTRGPEWHHIQHRNIKSIFKKMVGETVDKDDDYNNDDNRGDEDEDHEDRREGEIPSILDEGGEGSGQETGGQGWRTRTDRSGDEEDDEVMTHSDSASLQARLQYSNDVEEVDTTIAHVTTQKMINDLLDEVAHLRKELMEKNVEMKEMKALLSSPKTTECDKFELRNSVEATSSVALSNMLKLEEYDSLLTAVSAVEQAHRTAASSLRLGTDSSGECSLRRREYPAIALPSPSAERGPIINVGIVCFGQSGSVFHAPFIVGHPRFALVAVYERSKSLSLDFAKLHSQNIKIYRSVEDLVGREDLQLVVVCSPMGLHYCHAKLALEAGKHVLVEKAFTTSVEEAEVLFSLARAKGLICMPYQNRRYDSDFRTIQRMITQLGRITEFNGFYNRFVPSVRDSWKDQDSESGGNFLSLGSHMIDQAICLFGKPLRVWADIRTQRSSGVLDDSWEVHLYYNPLAEREVQQPSPSRPPPRRPGPPSRQPPKTPSSPDYTPPHISSPSSKFPNRPQGSSSDIMLSYSSLTRPNPLELNTFTKKIARSQLLLASRKKQKKIPDEFDNVQKLDDHPPSLPPTMESTSSGDETCFLKSQQTNKPLDFVVGDDGLHRGGFRVILKGSLLCADNSLRYVIHGVNGSWRKEGTDPQEAILKTGKIPPYPTTSYDPITGRPFVKYYGYGVENKRNWGTFIAADGSSSITLPELGSYYMLYDELYDSIMRKEPAPVSSVEALQVLKVIELAKLSSQYGQVVDFPMDEY